MIFTKLVGGLGLAALSLLPYVDAMAQQRSGAGAVRVALVIGNDTYQKVSPLRNARADARAMAQSLERAGFRVTLRIDAGERAMKEAVRTFKAQIAGGGAEAVFFFAGHGVQLGGGNYLLPADIGSDNEEQVKDDAVSLQRVLDDMQEQKARFALAIIDACRNNPFRSSGRAIGGRGLAPTTAASGQVVLFSAGAGQLALDRLNERDTHPNGLFTRIFLREMERPGIAVDQLLRNVREEVVQLAKSVGHEQVPALYDQAIGRFYFRPPTAGTQTASFSQEVRPATNPLQLEMMFWDSVKASTNADDFEEYKNRFPEGQFVGLADNRIRVLTQTSKPPAAPPVQLAVAPSSAQTFVSQSRPPASAWAPRSPVRIIVPFAPGGAADVMARTLAAEIGSSLGQPVIIENRPGAGGMIGAQAAARAPTDGLTLLFGSSSMLTITPQIVQNALVSEKDLDLIAQFGSVPLALLTPASVGSLRDAIGRQGAYGTPGVGTTDHIMMELFKSATRAPWTHVPYKGTAPAMTDLLGGQLTAMLTSVSSATPQVRSGKLRAHALTGNTRHPALPDVPTFTEQGIAGLTPTAWYFLAAPRGTSPDIIARYYHEVASTQRRTTIQQRTTQIGAMLHDLSPGDVTQLVRTESAAFGNVIRAAGIRAD